MSEAVLFPRLSHPVARRFWPLPEAVAIIDADLLADSESISWAASGGRRITLAELQAVRRSILEVAKAAGFPQPAKPAARSEFDSSCSVRLSEIGMPVSEALRDEVWSYFTAALLPDVCQWRFPQPPEERIVGGLRNTFQRLWLRSRAFDRGVGHPKRWELLLELTEDAMVQIIERPLLSNDSRIALAIGECWLRFAKKVGHQHMEDITRRAIPNVRMANEVIHLAALDHEELAELLDRHFERADSPSERTRGPALQLGARIGTP